MLQAPETEVDGTPELVRNPLYKSTEVSRAASMAASEVGSPAHIRQAPTVRELTPQAAAIKRAIANTCPVPQTDAAAQPAPVQDTFGDRQVSVAAVSHCCNVKINLCATVL